MCPSLSSLRHAHRSSSLTSLLIRHCGVLIASRSFSPLSGIYGPQESFQDGSKFLGNVPRRKISHHVGGLYGSSGLSSSIMQFNGNVTTPYALSFLSSLHSDACKDFLSRGGNPMNFVRDIIEAEDRNSMGQLRYSIERNADFVHIKLMRNNSFVTVTDSKGNKKFGASLGLVP